MANRRISFMSTPIRARESTPQVSENVSSRGSRSLRNLTSTSAHTASQSNVLSRASSIKAVQSTRRKSAYRSTSRSSSGTLDQTQQTVKTDHDKTPARKPFSLRLSKSNLNVAMTEKKTSKPVKENQESRKSPKAEALVTTITRAKTIRFPRSSTDSIESRDTSDSSKKNRKGRSQVQSRGDNGIYEVSPIQRRSDTIWDVVDDDDDSGDFVTPRRKSQNRLFQDDEECPPFDLDYELGLSSNLNSKRTRRTKRTAQSEPGPATSNGRSRVRRSQVGALRMNRTMMESNASAVSIWDNALQADPQLNDWVTNFNTYMKKVNSHDLHISTVSSDLERSQHSLRI